MSMDDTIDLKNIPSIGHTLVDTLDIDNLLNIKEIFSESHVILGVTNSRTFCELSPGTDLNVPPANWLHPSVNLPNLINIKLKNEESTSYYIANLFPECNNKVSVVAEAEVIKKLFKIPYNKESVSLMVRKIGNILLIDHFDIANFSGNQEITEENKLSQVEELNANLNKKANNSNKKLRQRNLFSKFLFRSVADDHAANEASDDSTSIDSLPDYPEEAGPGFKFSRIIYWTFEKTQMLIGTNSMNQYFFGSGAIRNVSLHVSDAGKPLKIANAIDIWLDNLMCDIPEAVICFHLDGIVKQYECIQTQNIPHLLGSQFSTNKIKASVQGIFSFLLNHEFQRNQNYWILKCKTDNHLKIFKLNMLEETDGQMEIIKTPFDFEYGKLCYRFWHNQYYYNTEKEGKEWSNTMLLEVSISTLNRKIHPEIIATSNYLIVHLSISYEIFKTTLFVKTKAEFQNCKKQPESVTKHCLDALNNINDGLKCLQYFCDSTNTERYARKKIMKSKNSKKFKFKFKNAKKQDEVIYINISSLFPKKEHGVFEALPTWQNINEDRDYWKNYLKFLFYQKAELVFGILAQQYFYCDMFGLCLRSLNMMVRSNKIKIMIDPTSHLIPINIVLIMAGDCCQLFSTVSVSENSMKFSSDDSNVRKMENMVITDEQYYKIGNTNINYGLQVNLKDCSNIELMEKAIEFYKRSLEYEEMDFIRKKLFASNLALCKLYYDILDEKGNEANSLHNLDQFEKYINQACNDLARSPLDQAYALFHRAHLHELLYIIYLAETITSYSAENNLVVYCKNFLESFEDALRILNTYNGVYNDDDIKELYRHFLNFIGSITKTLTVWKNESNSHFPENLQFSMYDCVVSGLKQIFEECAWHLHRHQDFLSGLACNVMDWCISGFLIKMEKIGMILDETDHFRVKNLHIAITFFSDHCHWKYYILALYENSTYLLGTVLKTDQFHVPFNQKIQNIKDALKMFCQVGSDFQKMIDTGFKDELFNEIINADDKLFSSYIPQFQLQIQKLLKRGIELVRPYSEEKQEFHTFKTCLLMFEDNTNRDKDFKLILPALIIKLKTMCIEMKFVINTI